MTVDRIEPLDKRRSKVFLDGSFAFVLYRGELAKYQIEEGGTVAEEKVRRILDEVIGRRARERALYLLKFSGRTEAELRRKLREGWYPEEAIEEAVQFLKRYGYVDDLEYTRNYVETNSSRKSCTEIRVKLREKGIDRETIEAAMKEQAPNEETQIRRILEKRRYAGSQTLQEEKRRHIAHLMRKGFSYEAVRRVMGDMDETGP